MNVKELRELLATFPDDLPVWSYANDYEPLHTPISRNEVWIEPPARDRPERLVIAGDMLEYRP